MRDGFAEAGRLGHQWVGPEHVLLALLREDRPSTARDVLYEFGLDHAGAERRMLAGLLDAQPPLRSDAARGAGVSSTPAWSRLDGWIEGFALASSREPTPEDALLGLCWAMQNPLSGRVPRVAVVAALAARGVPVPDGVPPADFEPSEHVHVPRGRLDAIRRALLHARGLVGFNVDPDNDTAWVCIRPGDTEARALIEAELRSDDPPS
jgi:hypothetical protein